MADRSRAGEHEHEHEAGVADRPRAEHEAAAIVRLGDRAVRFARPPNVAPRAIVDAARAWDGVIDVVVARDHVAVYFERDVAVHLGRDLEFADTDLEFADIGARIAELAALPPRTTNGRTIDLHAIYDGPDLDDIARAIDATTDDVARMHAAATYVVETMGFAPGFAYLTGLDARLAAIPRRPTPRTRVPASSLAIAGGYTAVYPFDSPGGWNLIGRVDEGMFDSDGALLHFGDRVRFVR